MKQIKMTVVRLQFGRFLIFPVPFGDNWDHSGLL